MFSERRQRSWKNWKSFEEISVGKGNEITKLLWHEETLTRNLKSLVYSEMAFRFYLVLDDFLDRPHKGSGILE